MVVLRVFGGCGELGHGFFHREEGGAELGGSDANFDVAIVGEGFVGEQGGAGTGIQPLALVIEREVKNGQLRAAFPIVHRHGVGQRVLAAWIEE